MTTNYTAEFRITRLVGWTGNDCVFSSSEECARYANNLEIARASIKRNRVVQTDRPVSFTYADDDVLRQVTQ